MDKGRKWTKAGNGQRQVLAGMRLRTALRFKNGRACSLSLLLLLVSLLVFGGAASWDSSTDPLVTKSWVDQYVAQKAKPLESRILALEGRLQSKTVLELWLNKTTMKKNGKPVALDTPLVLYNGRTMLPLRVLAEGLDAKIVWDHATKKATYQKGEIRVELIVNQKKMMTNSGAKALDTPPILKNDRVLVPVRVISDAFGAKVEWDNTAKKLTISY